VRSVPSLRAQAAQGSPPGAVAVQIAGARLVAVPADASVDLALSPAARAFACPPEKADIFLTVGRSDLSQASFGDHLLFDSGSLWQLWADGDGSLLRLASPFFGTAPYKSVHLDAGWQRATMDIHTGYRQYSQDEGPTDPFEYPLDELLITHWLSQGRGIELHACGIVDEQGRGYLFCGQSGAGKSTTARSWLSARPGTVLSDDRIVVRHQESQFWMYGTPWHGEAELATPVRARLTAVLLLRQAPSVRLVEVPPSEAVARLLACAFFPFYDAAAIAHGMECVARLVNDIPCLELELTRDHGFLELLAGI
jgi:hypothetical protein